MGKPLARLPMRESRPTLAKGSTPPRPAHGAGFGGGAASERVALSLQTSAALATRTLPPQATKKAPTEVNQITHDTALSRESCIIVARGPGHAAINAAKIETQRHRLRHNLGSGGFGVSKGGRATHVQDHLWRSSCLRRSGYRDHA